MTSPVQEIVLGQLLSNATATIYTAPAGTWVQIAKVTCVNTDAAAHTVTIYLVPPAGSAGAANITTSVYSILPGATWNSPNEYGHVLNPGGTIQALASSASLVNIAVTGILMT